MKKGFRFILHCMMMISQTDVTFTDGRIQETKNNDLKGNPDKQMAVESEEKRMESDGPSAGEGKQTLKTIS